MTDLISEIMADISRAHGREKATKPGEPKKGKDTKNGANLWNTRHEIRLRLRLRGSTSTSPFGFTVQLRAYSCSPLMES